jgi:hypothetical protein
MQLNTKQIIARIGETDQLFLQGNTPDLALERAELRLQLVTLSLVRQEQIHFLQEAIVILEQSRLEFEEMPLQLYINLSLHLAKAYMLFFEITKEKRYAIITKQIMKPMVNYGHGDILLFLAYAHASHDEPSMTRHWLGKYASTTEFNLELMQQHAAFEKYHALDWFKDLIKTKLH